MSQVRCPFCSSPNSADAEVCTVCGSKLKLASFNSSEENEPEPENTGDWLDNLRAGNDEGSTWNEDTTPEDSEAEPGELPDWLARIRQKGQEELQASEAGSEGEDSLPDWLRPADEPTSVPEVSETVDDWLVQLRGEESQESLSDDEQELTESNIAEPDAEEEPSFSAGPVDWAERLANEPLAAKGDTAAGQTEEPEDDHDWLQNLQEWDREEAPTSGESEEALLDAAGEEPSEELTFPFLAPAQDEPAPPESAAVFQDESVSNEMDLSTPVEAPVTSEELQPATELELTEETLQEEPPENEDEWFKTLRSHNEDVEEPILNVEEAAPADAEELPEWLKAMEASAQARAEAGQEAADTEEIELPVTDPFVFNEDVPDWLEDYKTEPEEEGGLGDAFRIGDELPPLEETTSPFTNEGVPDWLANEQGTGEKTAETIVPEEGENLEPAQLPGWLESMRPVEAVVLPQTPAQMEQRTEKSGPLAGIPEVLPGEDVVTRYHKPPVYSAKLQVSEKQRLHASLLETMISDEVTARPVSRERRVIGQSLPRAIIGLLVIGLVIFALMGGLPQLRYPTLYTSEAVAFHSGLNSISQEFPAPQVLLVIDYQPALSGELEAAAMGPLQDLIAQGGRLIILSTQATGPVLGEQLVSDLSLRVGEIPRDERVINLGYLAGGTTGLQAFVTNPRLAVQSTFETQNAWDTPILTGISNIDDFAAILVLTDSVESGRDWVEQVTPWQGDRSLMIVSSAQSAPLLEPYYASGQVDGLLSGWLGGVSYNFISRGLPGLDIASWNAYQYGMGLIIALILIGGLIQGVSTLFSNRKDNPGA